jgi:hypothetical protein
MLAELVALAVDADAIGAIIQTRSPAPTVIAVNAPFNLIRYLFWDYRLVFKPSLSMASNRTDWRSRPHPVVVIDEANLLDTAQLEMTHSTVPATPPRSSVSTRCPSAGLRG